MKSYIAVVFVILLLLFAACKDYTPKPVGYNRIDIKEGGLRKYVFPEFSFEYPESVRIDTLKSPDKGEFWFDMVYADYDAVIHCTYLPVTRQSLPKLIEDSYHLAYSHAIKADGIGQEVFRNHEMDVYGILYEINGNVATPFQFFVTDSVRHFLRGSLYYSHKVNPDSVAPVTGYVKKNIEKMMHSFRWER